MKERHLLQRTKRIQARNKTNYNVWAMCAMAGLVLLVLVIA